MPRVLRRFLLWTVLCVVSAAPSFLVAQRGFDPGAMALGVALFIVAYTATTSTDAFERFHNQPFVRRTLYIGYGLRVGLSIVFPVGLAADMLPGMVSLSIVESLGLVPRTFAGTLATTIVQGTVLNLLIGVFMLAVYEFLRAMNIGRGEPQEQPRGFEVIVSPEPAESTPPR